MWMACRTDRVLGLHVMVVAAFVPADLRVELLAGQYFQFEEPTYLPVNTWRDQRWQVSADALLDSPALMYHLSACPWWHLVRYNLGRV